MESEDALQALYWLADLEEECSPEHVRVVLLRGADQIESDQDDLWDRLPSHLAELLYAPSMNPGMRLPDVLWTRDALLP